MPKIKLKKSGKVIVIEKGANLMKSLTENQIPVASSCSGEGVCAKCRMQIIEGMENLTLPNETELFLREKFSLTKDLRISCQTQVLGDITVDTTYW
jgi:2Fe-2S ferredoxin